MIENIWILVDEQKELSSYVIMQRSNCGRCTVMSKGLVRDCEQIREIQLGHAGSVVHVDCPPWESPFFRAAMHYKWTIIKSKKGDFPYIEMMTQFNKENIHTHRIPEFLLEMSKQMNEQDNRITADPIFQVRHKDYMVTQEGYNQSHFELIDDEGNSVYSSQDCNVESLIQELIDYHLKWCQDWVDENLDNIDYDPDNLSEVYIKNLLLENYSESNIENDEFPESLTLLYMQEVEKVIKSCLTEADAKAFIKRKQHDYKKLYIYVESMVYCPQMIELRNWILNLT